MIDLGLWLLLTASLLMGVPGESWRVVYADGSVESLPGPPVLNESRLRQVSSVWAWSGDAAPRRIAPARIGRDPLPSDKTRLRVQVAGPAALQEARIIAGPTELWIDVPESLLPSWPVPRTGELSIPLDPRRPWRLRLVSTDRGTWWTDLPAGRTSVRLDPSLARTLSLQVTGRDGKPVEGTWMRVLEGIRQRRGRKAWSLHQGAQGAVSAPALPDAEEIVALVGAPGFVPTVLSGRPADLPERVQLDPGGAVVGRFADDRGRPLSDVRVRVEAWIASGMSDLISRSAATSPTGDWSVTALPAGEAVLVAQARGFVPYRSRIELRGGTLDIGTVRLHRGQELRLAVVDDLGAPLAGADVKGGPGFSAQTGLDGEAVIRVDPAEPMELEVSATHHLPWKGSIDTSVEPTLRIALDRAMNVQGRLVDSHGQPVGEGTAILRRGASSSSMALTSGGVFDFDIPAGVEAELTLACPTTRELRVPITPGERGERRDLGELKAPAGVEVTGRTTAASDGSPVAGARIWLPRPGGDGELLAWVDRNLLEARSGPDGLFRISGAQEGRLQLRVEAAGFARAYVAVQVEPGASAVNVGDLSLDRGADLRVVVSGKSTEGALARADLRGDWLEMDMLTAPVLDGVALLHNIPPGKVRISVQSGRTLVCDREVTVLEGEEAEVECADQELRVLGSVRIGDRPAAAGSLLWLPPAPELPGRITNVVSTGGLRQQRVVGEGRPQVEVSVADDGSFVTEELSSGRWEVSWLSASGSVSPPQWVDIPVLPAHAEWATVLTFSGGALSGIVVDSENRPVPEARVRDLGSGAVAISGKEGSFTFDAAGAGRHLLRAERDELTSAVVEVDVLAESPGEPVRLVLDDRESAEIRVKVLGVDQTPVSGAFVFLEEESKGQRLLTTGPGGLAVARIDPPAPARVRLAAMVNGTWNLGSWQSWEDMPEPVILAAGPSGSIRLETSETSGAPRVLSEAGWDVAWLSTRLGARPTVSPGTGLELPGLPEGLYTIVLGQKTSTVRVSAGEESTLEIDRSP